MVIEAHPEFRAGFTNINCMGAACAKQTIKHVTGITIVSLRVQSDIICNLNCGVSNDVFTDLTSGFVTRYVTSWMLRCRESSAHEQFSEIGRLTLSMKRVFPDYFPELGI